MEMTKESLCVNKLVCEKNEIIFVEGDMIVPDAKPDILNSISASGIPCIYRKEISDEKLKIDGSINTYIMYTADNSEDNVRGLNTVLDFSENLNLPNCTQEMQIELNTKVKTIECKVINGRKIGIKATLEVKIKVFEQEEIEIVNNMEECENIQMLKESLKVNSMIGTGNTKIYAKDTIAIDNIDNLAEILKTNLNFVDRDVKISYNKVLAKTEAQIKIMYLTEENRINTVNGKIPVVGFIDIPNVNENDICDVNYEIKNLIIKPNPTEEHSIYIEIETEANCTVYEEKEINMIQDLYSPCEKLEFNKRQITTMKEKKNLRQSCSIREKVNIEELENKTILDVDVISNITKQTKANTKIMLEGELELNIILSNNIDARISNRIQKVPFNFAIENNENAEDTITSIQTEVENQDFIIQNGGILTCNIDLTFDANCHKLASLNVIDDVQGGGELEEQDYNLIVYIVKKGDTLWKIAKKLGSTVEDIARVNGIQDENKITIGQKLFIPRYVKKGESSKKTPVVQYA